MMFALFAAAVVACFLFSINYHQLIETAAEAKQTHAEKDTHTERDGGARERVGEREGERERERGSWSPSHSPWQINLPGAYKSN